MIRHLVFWLWNDRMTPARIRKQLSMMKDAGVGGVFFHSMPREFGGAQYPEGMPGYLSPYYFRMIREAGVSPLAVGVEVISDAILAKGVEKAAAYTYENTVKVLKEAWPELLNGEK